METHLRTHLSALLALALVAPAALAQADAAAPAPTAAAAAKAAAKAAAAPDAKAAADAKADAPKGDAAARPSAPAPMARPLVAESGEEVPPPADEPMPPPPPARRVRRRPLATPPMVAGQARQGLILGLGLGGASQYASAPGYGTAGATDFDVRVGYGFNDRFQFFADFDFAHAAYGWDQASNNWTLMLKGQTVLIGDRKGNGLSLNGGVGLGGFGPSTGDYYGRGCCSYGYDRDPRLGFAVGGGLSFDARLGRYLALSPELFASWHVVPNADRKSDIATLMGLRVNLVWYLP